MNPGGPKPTRPTQNQDHESPAPVETVVQTAAMAGEGGLPEFSSSRVELPDLGTIAIIDSYATPGKRVVALGTTSTEFCITDPFSSSCSRFKANPAKDYGVTVAQIKSWWDAVQMLREEGDYDESAHHS